VSRPTDRPVKRESLLLEFLLVAALCGGFVFAAVKAIRTW
jgi:hypothetical protein